MGAEALVIAEFQSIWRTDRAGDGIAPLRRSLIGARVKLKQLQADIAARRIMAAPEGPPFVSRPPSVLNRSAFFAGWKRRVCAINFHNFLSRRCGGV
jgi:hypothetical protein